MANNGNVAQIENKRDTNRTQNFTYDELNRIRTASTQATSGTHAWGLQFGYDVWGGWRRLPESLETFNPT